MGSFEPIAIVDFSKYLLGTPAEQAQCCDELVAGLKRYGFIKLINYGLDETLVWDIFEQSRKFFAMDYEAKMVAAHPKEGNPHRGYSHVGQELTYNLARPKEAAARKNARIFDIKEHFDQGSKTDCEAPSVWPHETDIPGFRVFMEAFFEHCYDLHMELLSALANGLAMPATFFDRYHGRKESELRILHYPAVPATELDIAGTGKTRICEHTDTGSMTLLFQDSTGGLEIEDPLNGAFIPVLSDLPILVVNLGDSMQRWTNGAMYAGYHRVRAPPGTSSADGTIIPARYSVVYFGKPDRAASLKPFDEFVSEERPAMYGDMTHGEHNNAIILKSY